MADVNQRKIAGIILTPVVCAALLVIGVLTFTLGLNLVGNTTRDHADVDYLYLLGVVIITGLAAVTAYRIAGLLETHGWWAVLATLVPAVAFAILQLDKAFGKRESALAWLAGLTAALVIAALIAHRGFIRTVWIFGVLAAIAVADIAVLVQLMSSTGFEGEQAETLDRAYAPMWLLFALIDYDFGFDPLSWHIGDALDLREVGYPMYSMIAISYVIRSMGRTQTARES